MKPYLKCPFCKKEINIANAAQYQHHACICKAMFRQFINPDSEMYMMGFNLDKYRIILSEHRQVTTITERATKVSSQERSSTINMFLLPDFDNLEEYLRKIKIWAVFS